MRLQKSPQFALQASPATLAYCPGMPWGGGPVQTSKVCQASNYHIVKAKFAERDNALAAFRCWSKLLCHQQTFAAGLPL
jgi:hypothetical protein